jgi:hypothetical protein
MDKVMAVGTFRAAGISVWHTMAGSQGMVSPMGIIIPTIHTEEKKDSKITLDQMRAARIARLTVEKS